MIKETVTLYFKEGSSDKFYTASIEERDGEFPVTFVYGRTGTSGQSGIKSVSKSYNDAKLIYDKLIKEKTGKGYKPDANAVSYAGIGDKTDTGIRPHLLKMIDEPEVEKYIISDEWVAQEKYDGHRKFLDKDNTRVRSINRKGQEVGYPVSLETACLAVNDPEFIIDGEEIGESFYAYDIIKHNGISLENMPYTSRYQVLSKMLSKHVENLILAPLYFGEASKRDLYVGLKLHGKEGIVFKKKDSVYAVGRNNDQVKFKFYSTASCIVAGINTKRSISIGVYDNDNLINIGNCMIPPNYKIPDEGSVVEIRYLYAYRGGSLYQPIYEGERTDIDPAECSISQLKYKAETEEQ